MNDAMESEDAMEKGDRCEMGREMSWKRGTRWWTNGDEVERVMIGNDFSG